MNQPLPLLDIDTPEYVTLRRACEITGRSERTIRNWCRLRKVGWVWRCGVCGYSRGDLEATVRQLEQRQQASRFRPR